MAKASVAQPTPDTNNCLMHTTYMFNCGTCNGVFNSPTPTPTELEAILQQLWWKCVDGQKFKDYGPDAHAAIQALILQAQQDAVRELGQKIKQRIGQDSNVQLDNFIDAALADWGKNE